ncbi:MAG TPA: DinB family protein [Gemmatimonadales bacterium]|nr:DinB family protein [Gemmatimonadales bacterium]
MKNEFKAAQARLHRLVQVVPEAAWSRRPDPARWSIAECVGHLNLTSQAYLPLLRAALARGGEADTEWRGRYRRDPIGWLMWRMAGSPVRHRVKTVAAFVPAADQSVPELVGEFDRLQDAQLSCVSAADGVPLGRLWIRSPFDARIRYNVFSCLTILPRHQERHLWQAEQVWEHSKRV